MVTVCTYTKTNKDTVGTYKSLHILIFKSDIREISTQHTVLST